MPAPASSPAQLPARTVVLIELALALGGIGIGTGEFSIMDLMPNVAGALGVDAPAVGHLISAYARGVMVGAPVLAPLGSSCPAAPCCCSGWASTPLPTWPAPPPRNMAR